MGEESVFSMGGILSVFFPCVNNLFAGHVLLTAGAESNILFQRQMEISETIKKQLSRNLGRTFELIRLQQGLKFSIYKKLYPKKSDEELIGMMNRARMRRKQT